MGLLPFLLLLPDCFLSLTLCLKRLRAPCVSLAIGFNGTDRYSLLRQAILTQAAMLSSDTTFHDEDASWAANGSEERETMAGVSNTGVLVLITFDSLCTRRCFSDDFPAAGGPMKMVLVTSSVTEPCLLTARS